MRHLTSTYTARLIKAGIPQAGFSLIEIVISMVIMAILLFSFAMMFSQGKAFVQGQGDQRVAIHLAQEGLEYWGSMSFAAVEAYLRNGAGVPVCRVMVTESPPETFDGIPMDGRDDASGNPLPDYSDYQRQTLLNYVHDEGLGPDVELADCMLPASPCAGGGCDGYNCTLAGCGNCDSSFCSAPEEDPTAKDCTVSDYLRIQVGVSNTKSAAETGYTDGVSLETIKSRWNE